MSAVTVEVVLWTPPKTVETGFQAKRLLVKITNKHPIDIDDTTVLIASFKNVGFTYPANNAPQKVNTNCHIWDFNAERMISELDKNGHSNVLLHVQCELNNGKTYYGPWFEFSQEIAYWLSAKPLVIYSKKRIGLLYKRFRKWWNSVAIIASVGGVILFIVRLLDFIDKIKSGAE